MKVNHLELFHGIGGMSLGLNMAGIEFENHYGSEVDPYAIKVWKKHYPKAVELGDITKIDGRKLGRIDILTGGFPCQPFSLAGKRKGKKDDRYLWPEMFRIIKEAKPSIVFGENVPGINGLALDDALSDLESEGYEVAPPLEIPARAVGAPHLRYRYWIIAYAGKVRCHNRGNHWERRQVLQDKNWNAEKDKQKWKRWKRWAWSSCEDGPHSHSERCQVIQGRKEIAKFNRYGAFGDSSWWDVEPAVGRVANGVPHRVDRLKCLGNAVVPQVVAYLAELIIKPLLEKKDYS